MRFPSKTTLSVAFTMVAVIGFAFASYRALRTAQVERTRGREAFLALAELDGLLLVMLDAETGSRGYALTGQTSYLAPYEAAVEQAPGQLAQLAARQGAGPWQDEQLMRLQDLMRRRLAILQRLVAMVAEHHQTEALQLVQSGVGQATMDELRQLVEQMKVVAMTDLRAHDQRTEGATTALFVTTLLGGLVTLLLVIISSVATARELSVRVAAETALHTSQQRYRSLENATSDLVWTMSPDGVLHDLPAWVTFTGQTAAEAAGLGWLQAVHPDEREHVIAELRSALASHSIITLEHRMRRHDGQYLHFAVRAVPVLESDGRVREWVGLHTDITWTKQVEIERVRLNTVIRQSSDLVGLAELDGTLIFLNDAGRSMIGLGPADAIARPLFDLLMPDDVPLARDTVLPTVLKDGHWRGEVRLRHFGTGQSIDVDYNVFLIRAPTTEAPIGIATISRDITAQKRASAEREKLMAALARSNAELDQFAYVASHDLKAPLRGISNLSTWIEEDLADRMTDEARKHMNLLRGRVRRLEGLIDGILAYSRAGRVSGDKAQTVDVQKLMESIIELLAPPVEVAILFTTPLPTLVTEPVPLQQVLMNLLGNALKYGAQVGARIEVSARALGPRWEFTVKDNGPGIDPQFHDKVWAIFQTLAPRDRVEGTGIGLSVVRKVVEAKGGRAWLESALGEGASFKFTWPSVEGPLS